MKAIQYTAPSNADLFNKGDYPERQIELKRKREAEWHGDYARIAYDGSQCRTYKARWNLWHVRGMRALRG